LKKTERPYNLEEIKTLRSRKNSLWQHFENFGLKWILVLGVLLAPLLIYDKFIDKVSSDIQLWTTIPLVIISIVVVGYWMNKNGELNWNKTVENEIKNGKAQVLKIKTEKVIKRKDPEDFGSGFYLKIDENKTIFLQGQYLDELQYSRKFPNTDFEIVRTKLSFNELIDINSFGKYLKPERKLEPFSKEQYKSGNFHCDGDILEIPIDEIK
jgi:hypothetical protein